jgi:hypothetical protein
MNCYVCAVQEEHSTAVAICPHCGAALCLRHIREEAAAPRPGGMFMTCSHHIWSPEALVRTG